MADFQHGIFDCFGECGMCLVTTFIPCLQSGKNAEAMGENCLLYGLSTWCGFGFITDALIRQKIREKYGIDVSDAFNLSGLEHDLEKIVIWGLRGLSVKIYYFIGYFRTI